MSNYTLNMNTIPLEVFTALTKIDDTFVGTPDYMGIAYFWGWEYRHYLRSTSFHKRKKVHSAFIKSGLPLEGESEKHFTIVKRFCELDCKLSK